MSGQQAGSSSGVTAPTHSSVGSPSPDANSATVLSPPDGFTAGASPLARTCPSCGARYPGDFRVCPRDATPLQDTPDAEHDPLLGSVLGDAFRVVRLVGEGGMARVYEAQHVRLPNRSFAVKVLNAAHAHQPEVVTRFQREAEATSGIDHPNVMDVYDVSRASDGTPYLVSEFLRGTDLATLLDERKRLPAELVVNIVRQVARALGAAHAQGIVHRDVKPENVFLVGDGNAPVVKVLDFGISRMGGLDGSGSTLTRTGMVMGTPGYMPPEQARGGKVDHRADIYGVGAMLYRALTGHLVFDSDDPAEVLGAVLTREPPRPRLLEPSIPEALELVVERCLAKNPDDRYASMSELDQDLEPFGPASRATSILPPPFVETADFASPAAKTETTIATMMAASRPAPTALQRVTREAQWARPSLVLLTALAYVWVAACLADAIASILILVRKGNERLTSVEAVLVSGVVVAVLLTPAIYWLRHLVKHVWPNSSRSLYAATVLRRVTLAGLSCYAIAALGLRLLASVSPSSVPTPQHVGLLLTTVSLLAGTAMFLAQPWGRG
ncbi:serine/threonine-protein kinase [Myxococcota bacterium]